MLYTMGDLHLSFGTDKKMDVFGNEWSGYEEKLAKGLAVLTEGDSLVLCGDSSWGGGLKQALPDFQYIHQLPGKKILLKGNHDYFWETNTKLSRFFAENRLDSLSILHNNAFLIEGTLVCGTKGWNEPLEPKLLARETGRLRLSLEAGRKLAPEAPIAVFLHYPPIVGTAVLEGFLELFAEFSVQSCYYGHLHGYSRQNAFEGLRDGVSYRLVSADHLNFCPLPIC